MRTDSPGAACGHPRIGGVASQLKAPWGQSWAHHVLFFFFFLPRHAACGIFPDQGFSPGPLHREGGVLIPGLPEKSLRRVLLVSLEEMTSHLGVSASLSFV